MPTQNPQSTTQSPFEITSTTKSKKGNKGLIVAVLVVVFLILSVVLGVILVRQNQNVAEKASTTPNSCPEAEACPGPDGVLYSCHPPEANGDPDASICNVNLSGRISACGGSQYCCNGTTWSTDMASCVVATPSPTATAVATATASASPTATALATTTPDAGSTATPVSTSTAVPTLAPASTSPTAQSTSLPIPVTGTDWPTVLGAGVGVVVIIASILIAL